MRKLLSMLVWACALVILTAQTTIAETPDYSGLSTEELNAKAEAGDPHAYYTLGHDLFFNTDSGPADIEKLDETLKLMRKADELGHAEAPSFLALYYYGEFETDADPKKAKAALIRGIERDGKGSKLNFILRYIDSEFVKESSLAQKLLLEASKDPESTSVLAPEFMQMYSFGTNTLEPDLKKGREFAKTCSKGQRKYTQCNFLYARYLQNGWGGEKDLESSTLHFKRAAEADDPRAQWNYGMALLQGIGTDLDLEAAYHWVKKSASQDYLDGLLSFAVMNAIGQGTEINYDLAYSSYEKAAKHGSAHALRGMSLMMMEGQGTSKNEKMGLAALLVADENGEPNARKLLSYLFQTAPNLETQISGLRTELAPQIAQIKNTYDIKPVN